LAGLVILLLVSNQHLVAEEKVLLNESFGPEFPAGWEATDGTLLTNDSTGLNGYALVYSRGTKRSDTAQTAHVSFEEVKLENPGDTLTLSFTLRGITYGPNTANRMTYGFFSSQGDQGVIGLLRADPRVGFSGPPTQFRILDGGPSFNVTDYPGTVIQATTVDGTPFYLNGSPEEASGNIQDSMQIVFTMTRQSNGDLLLSQTVTNTATQASFATQATASAEEVPTHSFNVLCIGHSRGGVEFAIDDVLVKWGHP
jgi:hypothetical protein